MKLVKTLVIIGVFLGFAGSAFAMIENFDSYPVGNISGLGGWRFTSEGSEATTTIAYSLPNSFATTIAGVSRKDFSTTTLPISLKYKFYLGGLPAAIDFELLQYDNVLTRFFIGGSLQYCLITFNGETEIDTCIAGSVPTLVGWYEIEIQIQKRDTSTNQERVRLHNLELGTYSDFTNWVDTNNNYDSINALAFFAGNTFYDDFITSNVLVGNLNPYPASSTLPLNLCASVTKPSNIFDVVNGVQWAICNSAQWLFVPDNISLQNFQDLGITFQTKAPFAYFYSITNAFGSLSATATPAFILNASSTGALNTSLFQPLRFGLSEILWLIFAVWLVKRIGIFDF